MKFISCEKQLPKENQVVLVKLKDYDDFNYNYYVCSYEERYFSKGDYYFLEAGGENYMSFEVDEVIGWMPLEELNNIEVD